MKEWVCEYELSFSTSCSSVAGVYIPSYAPTFYWPRVMNMIGPFETTVWMTKVDNTTMNTDKKARQKWNFRWPISFQACLKKNAQVEVRLISPPSSFIYLSKISSLVIYCESSFCFRPVFDCYRFASLMVLGRGSSMLFASDTSVAFSKLWRIDLFLFCIDSD